MIQSKTLLNIASNAIAKFWEIILLFVSVPIFVKLLGEESYGLIGFYATLFTSLKILDLGLSRTITREIAKSISQKLEESRLRDMIYSLELVYISIGFVAGLLVILLSRFISVHWINTSLELSDVVTSVIIMGLIIMVQWPKSIYGGGLMGMHMHFKYNLIVFICISLQYIGAIFLLYFFSITTTHFFLWQLFTTGLMSIALRLVLWRNVPGTSKPVFSIVELRSVWKFALGMLGVGLTAFFLTQIDKILLSKTVLLNEFGYYTMAWMVGTSTLIIVNLMGNVFFPKLAELASRKNTIFFGKKFHLYNKIIVSSIVPLSLILMFYMEEVLTIWLGNEIIVDSIELTTRMLLIGTVLNGFFHVTVNSMLALGHTKFIFLKNGIVLILLLPVLAYCVLNYGIIGATVLWIGINIVNVFIVLPLIHFKYFCHIKLFDTIFGDFILPLLVSLITIVLYQYCVPKYFISDGQIVTIKFLLYLGCLIFLSYSLILLIYREFRAIFCYYLQFIR